MEDMAISPKRPVTADIDLGRLGLFLLLLDELRLQFRSAQCGQFTGASGIGRVLIKIDRNIEFLRLK